MDVSDRPCHRLDLARGAPVCSGVLLGWLLTVGGARALSRARSAASSPGR